MGVIRTIFENLCLKIKTKGEESHENNNFSRHHFNN